MPVLTEPKVEHEREIKQPVIDIITTYSYEEAFEKSLKYFNGNDLAAKVFLDKYALRDNNDALLEATPDQMHRRLAREFARIEKDKFKKPLSEDEIFTYLDEFKRIIPQGSILYGVGNKFQTISLSNCFVLDSPLDSYGGIHRTDEQLSQISKRRGGTGLDVSHLRPNKAAAHNAARTSTGIIPFMERYSNSIREVGMAGRRGALMITCSVHHPEVLEFAKVKRDLTRVTGANISVRLTDEFLNAVQKNEGYEQRWPVDSEKPKISQVVNAREAWMQLVENAWACLPYDEKIVVYKDEKRCPFSIGEFVEIFANGDNTDVYEIDSLNLKTLCVERKKIVAVQKYVNNKNIHNITLRSNRSVRLTEDHILYRLGNDGRVECASADEISIGDKIAIKRHNMSPGFENQDRFFVNIADILSHFNSAGNRLTGDQLPQVLSDPKCGRILGYYPSKKCRRVAQYIKEKYIPVKDVLTLRANGIDLDCSSLFLSPARQPDLKLPMCFPIDYNLAFLMGLWVAEGSIHKNSLRFHVNKHEVTHYTRYLDSVCANLQCSYQVISMGGDYSYIGFYSTFLMKLFQGLGFISQEGKKNIPSIVYNFPTKLSAAFLNGVFSGDATVSKAGGAIVLAQSDERLLECLRYVLLDFGIHVSIYKSYEGGKKYIDGKLCNIKDGFRLMIYKQFNRQFKDIIGLAHGVKHDRLGNNSSHDRDFFGVPYQVNESLFYKELCRTKRDYVSIATVEHKPALLEDNSVNAYLKHEVYFDKVIRNDICNDNCPFVYDLTVDDNHTFSLENGICLSNSAEPGLIFWDNIIRESPADCYASEGFRTTCCNPCAELPLSPLDSCRLLLLNLFTYVEHPFKKTAKFNFDAFAEDVIIAERLMDDVIDLEIEKIDDIIKKVASDPEPADVKRIELNLWKGVKKACEQGRRTGLGITALGDALAALGIDYGSDKGLKTTEKIYRTLKLNAYRSSVNMAKEIGHFPVWDHDKEKDCSFLLRIKEQDEDLWNDMRKHGRRNISLLTTAPAGTVSILAKTINRFGTSSGIEPQFTVNPYTRRKKINPNDENAKTDFVDQSGDHWQEFEVYSSAVLDWIDESGEQDLKKSPWHNSCGEELDWKQRVKLQAVAQKHIDHSISSTLNLPEDVSVEQVAEIYETAWKAGVKGITVYRKNCRTGVLIEKNSERNGSIVKTTAPKRPKSIDSELYFTAVKGEHYFVIVGALEGGTEPYEIFVGNNGFVSKRGPLKGSTIRESRGRYNGIFDGDIELRNISSFCSDEEESLTRMISTALRHGADAAFVVHQLEKAKGDLQSPSKAIARVLKRWIKDGTKITGESCETCGGDLKRESGCAICISCGASKCM